MADSIRAGDCVKIPDGRLGRVRDERDGRYKVRVRRKTSKTHQMLVYGGAELELVQCPKGWMSPEGYNRYLMETLAKMHERGSSKGHRREARAA